MTTPRKKPAKKPATKERIAQGWFPIGSLPEQFFREVQPGTICTPREALSLTPMLAGLEFYQSEISKLPIHIYKENADGTRERVKGTPEEKILQRPNPAMGKSSLVKRIIYDMIFERGFFGQIRKTVSGDLLGIYPIDPRTVIKIQLDAEWKRVFTVQTPTGQEVYFEDEIIYLFFFSKDGIIGDSVIDYCGQALGIHKTILDSASNYYENSARPNLYVTFKSPINPDTAKTFKQGFEIEHGGKFRNGSTAILGDSGEMKTLPRGTAEDMAMIEALNLATSDCARVLNIHKFLLGDTSESRYASLSAENEAKFEKSILPMVTNIEAELTHKLFGVDSNFYIEFFSEYITRGEPEVQSAIFTELVGAGILTVDEVRSKMNLPPLPPKETPIANVQPATNPATQPVPQVPDNGIPVDGGVEPQT